MIPEGPPITIPAAAQIEQTLELADALYRYFSGRPWTLMHFEKRSLILSDVPIGLVRRDDDEDVWMGVGVLTAWGVTFPLTRKLGLLMNDPTYLINHDVPVEKTRAGEYDLEQTGTTAMEKLFNEHTAAAASMRLFHHPDDARFVPAGLREPSPLTMSLQGTPREFSGDPYFQPRGGENVGDKSAPGGA